AGVDPAALRAQADRGTLPAILRALVRGPVRRRVEAAVSVNASALLERLAGASEAEQAATLLELVRSQAATVLGHSSTEQIHPDRAFSELGFDSLTGVELRNRLGTATGRTLPATLVFDYPSPAALVGYLRAEIVPAPVAAHVALLADIDRLDAAIEAARADPEGSLKIATRLQALAWKWNAGPDESDDFTEATDDELFRVLDGELGTA